MRHQLSAVSYQLSAFNYQLPAIGFQHQFQFLLTADS
jgi:hypothetical protein